MKLHKEYLIRLISEAIEDQIENVASTTIVDRRLAQLDRYRIENNLKLYEVLEDILEQLDETSWKKTINGLNFKYGHVK